MDMISGSCLCDAVRFEMNNVFSQFYFCHCDECKKITGSAHASNLFSAADNIQWLSGEHLLTCYTHASRDFHKTFCRVCGSGLPWFSGGDKGNGILMVPAGCLNGAPNIAPNANLFWREHAPWLEEAMGAVRHDSFMPG